MKLENKMTGEVVNGALILKTDDQKDPWYFESVAELVKHWEDCKGPFIKDEKIRKAVRTWAEANNIKAVYYYPEGDGFYVNNFDDEIVASIHFADKPIEDGYGEQYTIEELCGEEK